MRYFWSAILLLLALLFAAGCTADVLPEPTESGCQGTAPTYDGEVAEIIERTCSYSSCHLGGAPGLYDGYQGLLSDLESGLFRERVIALKDNPTIGMPPDYAPEGRQQDLTEAELEIITCWLQAGHPES